MSEANIKAELTQSLKSLHLPTIRQCYEEVARQAERETLSYERYLHELVERECEERQENRMSKLLRESQLPLEKSLGAFDTRSSLLIDRKSTRLNSSHLVISY